MKELESVRKIIEEEYADSMEQLSYKKKFLVEQKNEIREQERFLQILEQEKEKKTEFLSAYNNDEMVSHRIIEEKKKKETSEKRLKEAEREYQELTEKSNLYRAALDDLQKVDGEDSVMVSGRFVKEMEELLDQVLSEYSKSLKKIEQTVDEYIYMDPERVKVEILTSIKESKSFLRQVKAIRKNKS